MKVKILNEAKEENVGNSKFIGEEGGYKIYQPLDYKASMELGNGSNWCISSSDENTAKAYFNTYSNAGVKIYFFLDANTMKAKYAAAKAKDTIEIFDFSDKVMDKGAKIYEVAERMNIMNESAEDKKIANSKFIGEEDGYKVYQPLDYKASMELDKGGKWCISSHDERKAQFYFDDFAGYGMKIYFFLDANTMKAKYVAAKVKNVIEIFDSKDNIVEKDDAIYDVAKKLNIVD